MVGWRTSSKRQEGRDGRPFAAGREKESGAERRPRPPLRSCLSSEDRPRTRGDRDLERVKLADRPMRAGTPFVRSGAELISASTGSAPILEPSKLLRKALSRDDPCAGVPT